MASKEDMIDLYIEHNEDRLLGMTVEEQLQEVCEQRRVLRKAKNEHDDAKRKVEQTQEYRDVQAMKKVIKGGEIAIEATLRVIESQQQPLWHQMGASPEQEACARETVNTVTGEVVPAPESMVQPRVWGPLDPVGPAA